MPVNVVINEPVERCIDCIALRFINCATGFYICKLIDSIPLGNNVIEYPFGEITEKCPFKGNNND